MIVNPTTSPKCLRWCLWVAAASLLAGGWVRGSVTIEVQIGDLPIDAGTVGILVADAAGDGFYSLERSTVLGTNLEVGARLGPGDDVIVAVLQAGNQSFWQGGIGFAEVLEAIDYEALGISQGVALKFYWLPQQTSLPATLARGESFGSLRSNVAGASGGTIPFSSPANRGVYSIVHLSLILGGDFDPGNPGPIHEVGQGTVGLGASAPDLNLDSDSGEFDDDGITNDNTPTFKGTGPVGVVVTLTSDRDGDVGSAVVDSNGDWVITATALTDGIHQISATDGGEGSTPLQITIDTTPPPASAAPDLDSLSDLGPSQVDDITRDNTPKVTGNVAESSAVVTLTSDVEGIVGTTTTNGLWSIDTSILSDGIHELTTRVRDVAGNTSSVSPPLLVTIDTAAPTLTVNQALGQADPATSGPVLFLASFSEDVTGFGNSDVNAGGSAAGAVTVSGGPSNYTVSVATTSNEGTVSASIGANAATDTAGNLSSASTSGDNGVILDAHGDDGGSATMLNFSSGSTTSDGWMSNGDTDVFSFTLSSAQTVNIRTTGSVDTRGVLRANGGSILNDPEADKNAGAGANFSTDALLPAGTYTVTVTSEGSSQTGAYTLLISGSDISLVINEVDTSTPDANSLAFVELFDGGSGSFPLDGFVLVLFDGDTDQSYAAIDLDGESTDAIGYFVIGGAATSNVDVVIPDGTLESGADAVAIYSGNDSDFPNGTVVTTLGLLDAVVYDTGQSDDAGLLALLNASEPQLNEDEHGNLAGHSMQRLPNGAGGVRNTTGFSVFSPTPGIANDLPGAPVALDLTSASDSGSANNDDVTNVATPTIAGTARPGSLVVLTSDEDGDVGTGVADTLGNWSITLAGALSEGIHSLTAVADGGMVSNALLIEIDTQAPGVPVSLDLSTGSDSGVLGDDNITKDTTPTIGGDAETGASVSLTSNLDGVVGIGTANSPFSITTNLLRDGVHSITANATDVAGNLSDSSGALLITIDSTAPTVTVEQAGSQSDPTAATPVDFSITFSESVVGFVVGDVIFGGSANPSSPGLTGSGMGYTATAGAVGGEGIVTADVFAGVATDVAGNTNEASSSSDNVVSIDTHGNDSGSPTAVSLTGGGGAVSGFLTTGDIDVFSFVLTEARQVQIETTGPTDTLGRLLDSGDSLLNDFSLDDDQGANENFRINQALVAGTYTVEVSGKGASPTGAYELVITPGAILSFQPDVRVGTSVDGGGADLRLIARKARPVSGVAVIENRGDVVDSFRMQGTPGTRLFRVRYIHSTEGNVTGGITLGTFQTSDLQPGDPGEVIRVSVIPNKRKIIKKIKRRGKKKRKVLKKRITLVIRGTSEADSEATDAGTIRVLTK